MVSFAISKWPSIATRPRRSSVGRAGPRLVSCELSETGLRGPHGRGGHDPVERRVRPCRRPPGRRRDAGRVDALVGEAALRRRLTTRPACRLPRDRGRASRRHAEGAVDDRSTQNDVARVDGDAAGADAGSVVAAEPEGREPRETGRTERQRLVDARVDRVAPGDVLADAFLPPREWGGTDGGVDEVPELETNALELAAAEWPKRHAAVGDRE